MGDFDTRSSQFLGCGMAYPIRIVNGIVVNNRLEEHVRQSILTILKTEKNERPMLPDFGAGLGRYVFTGIYSAVLLMLKRTVFEALEKYEPRIDVINVEITTETEQETVLYINIEYRIRSNDSVHNLVYPYYAGRGRGEI